MVAGVGGFGTAEEAVHEWGGILAVAGEAGAAFETATFWVAGEVAAGKVVAGFEAAL